jgi:hypothetical protein
MSKYFQVSPKVKYQSKQVIETIAENRLIVSAENWNNRERNAEQAMQQECDLKYVHGRVILKIDAEAKNRVTFSNGIVIRRERRFNNFNFREVNPTNAFVVSAENYPTGAEMLIDYTVVHDTYKIFDYDSGSHDVVFYSVKESDCFAWRTGKEEWKPTKGFEFGLRVFKPYEGNLVGILPKKLEDVLYCYTGELKGKVLRVLRGADYQMIFTNDEGKEGNIIAFNHSENPDFEKEVVIAIADDLTEQLNEGKLLIGLTPHDCKKINE